VQRARLRLIARRAAKAVCDRLPESWALRLRSRYHAGVQTGLVRGAQRALLELVRLRGVPPGGPFPVPGRPAVRMVPSDSSIASYLFWLGIDGYEPGEPDWWARLVAAHRSVLEIGANIGLYTAVGGAAGPAAYRAVEANPSSCGVLRRNLAVNELTRVEVVEAAVVGERGTDHVTLRFPDRDPYSASAGAFVDGAVRPGLASSRCIVVPAIPIADLVEGVDLVKLDIEGSELDVLSAVRPWIAATEPTLVIEVLDEATDLQRFLADLIADVGYLCLVIVGHQPVSIPPSVIGEGTLQARCGTRDVTLMSRARATRFAGPPRHG
jgi:FkbM family methyltransferase